MKNKKKYLIPAVSQSFVGQDILCFGIMGSTRRTSGNLSKQEEEDEEELEALLMEGDYDSEKRPLWKSVF